MVVQGGQVSGDLATCYWSTEKPKYHNFLGVPKVPEDKIEIMRSARILLGKGKDVLQGFRCPNCETVLFSYGEEKKG